MCLVSLFCMQVDNEIQGEKDNPRVGVIIIHINPSLVNNLKNEGMMINSKDNNEMDQGGSPLSHLKN